MEHLTEARKEQIVTMCNAIPKMSEFDKGYFLGKAEEVIRQAKGAQDDRNKH